MKTQLLRNKEAGFTLLEIIVTLIIVSILGAMLASMMGGVLTNSTKPALQAREVHFMNQVADSVSRAYRELGSVTDLQNSIAAGDFDPAGSGITVAAALTGYGTGSAPVEGSSSDLLKVTITGNSGLTYTLLVGDLEI